MPIRWLWDHFGPNRYELEHFLVPGKAPFALICPGGGYEVVCSEHEGTAYAKALNRKGIHAFVLHYRVKDKARYPAPQDDVARAIREILDHADQWNVDLEGYSVWGSSAGGHLAASFGTKKWGYSHYGLPKPTALVLCYPVISMGEHSHLGSREYLLGTDPTPELRKEFSIEHQVTSEYPPTFVWNSAKDELVPPENGQMLATALKHADVYHSYLQFPNGKHGIGLAKGTIYEPWFDEALAFWQKARQG